MKLRQLCDKDIDGMLSWMKDPEINQFFRFNGEEMNREKTEWFVQNAKNDTNNAHFAVVDDEDNYIGTVSLKNIDLKARNAEYAISMCRKVHGTGASLFATQEILKYGFENLELERIYLNVLSNNYRAIRFYEKCNFVYEGEFRKHIMIRGKLYSLKWYSILKDEYICCV